MADAVSKLYAEIGFKVNDEELKKAEKVIKGLAATLSQINNNAKEAAKEYGIFSKQRSKQALDDEKLATQHEKTQNQRAKRVIESEKFKHKQLMDYAKFAMQVEKYNNQEKEKEDQKQLHNTQKTLKAMKSVYDNAYSGISKTISSAGRVFQRVLGISVGDAVGNALRTSVPIRDLLMQTGLSFTGTQAISRRFANIGINAPQEQILSDLQAVQQNIMDISFGAKGKTFPYKMLGVAARKGDMLGTLNELGKAIQDLRNPEALNLLRRIGLDDKYLAYFRFREKGKGLESTLSYQEHQNLVDTQVELEKLRYGFKETAKILTSSLKPAIEVASKLFLKAFDGIILAFRTKEKQINAAFEKLAEKAVNWINDIKWEDLPNKIENFVNSLTETFETLRDLVAWLGEKILGKKKGRTSKGENVLYEVPFLGLQVRSTKPNETLQEMRENVDLLHKYLKPNTYTPISYTNANTINIEGVTPDKMAETAQEVTRAANQTNLPGRDVFAISGNEPAYISGNFSKR